MRCSQYAIRNARYKIRKILLAYGDNTHDNALYADSYAANVAEQGLIRKTYKQ
jgi:hypothetical protein